MSRGHPDDFAAGRQSPDRLVIPSAAAGVPPQRKLLRGRVRRSRRRRTVPGHAAVGEQIHPLVAAYMAAGVSIGAPRLAEHNGGPLAGVAPNQLTIRNGRRVSAADAYLAPGIWGAPT